MLFPLKGVKWWRCRDTEKLLKVKTVNNYTDVHLNSKWQAVRSCPRMLILGVTTWLR
jgi:hypothetical protein